MMKQKAKNPNNRAEIAVERNFFARSFDVNWSLNGGMEEKSLKGKKLITSCKERDSKILSRVLFST